MKIKCNKYENRGIFWDFHIDVWKWMLVFCMAVICNFFIVNIAEAGEQLYFDQWGNLRMTTYDKIATSNKTYKTIGWTIKRYDRPIGPGNESVVVIVEDDGLPQKDPSNPAYQYCSFWCDKQTIFNKIGEVSGQWQQELYSNGGMVYLDAVMTVCIQGEPQGGLLNQGSSSWGRVYNTFEGIAGAESWADPEALRSHFGKQVYFQANPTMLVSYCDYQVKYYECFDERSEVWTLSRFQKDRSGQLALGEEIALKAGTFDGYYLEFDSARIRIRDTTGKVTESWSHEEALKLSYTDKSMASITIDVFYKRVERTETKTDQYNMSDNQVNMNASMGILAGSSEGMNYDVRAGVPAGEDLCVYGSLNAFGYQVTYKKHYGMKTLPVTIKTVYHCQWTDAGGNVRTQQVTGTETYYVDRPYSYWEIEDIDVRTLENIVLHNYAFAGEQVSITDLYSPKVQIEKKTTHLQMNSPVVFQVDGGVLYGEAGKVALPKGLYQNDANTKTGSYTVCNDIFSIDGEVFLAGNEVTSYTGDPKLGSVGKTVSFYKDKLTIPVTRRNGYKYQSRAVVNYVSHKNASIAGQDFRNINPVTIHTPVVCHGFITDEKQFNQLCQPDSAKKTCILGRNFEVAISSYGQHADRIGYGERDYGKYVKASQIRFPFEVYYGDVHYDANVWINYVENQKFFLPTAVKEGDYTIRVRTLSTSYVEADEASMGAGWNEYLNQYGAYEDIDIVVCGRLYGLKITDISRECWRNVFYNQDGSCNGNGYYVGRNNLNGEMVRRNPLTAFPILQGGNPFYPQEEGEPLGTTFSFELQTMGDYKKTDGVYIEPRFYVVDSVTGKNRREVDIYHFYEKNGQDVWENIKRHSESGIQYLRSGARNDIGSYVKNVTDRTAALKSVQKWSSEFVIPNDIFVVPKDLDIEAYIARKGMLDTTDNIFIRDGYLMVQFEIYSIKNGQNHMNYINEENAVNGYASMWKIEGFFNPRPQADLSLFYVEMGDVFLYDLKTNGESLHKIVGTH